MKKLVSDGNRMFANRKDRDYIQELLDIGITEEEAWQEILTLSAIDYCPDYRPFYKKESNDNALIFKKNINNNMTYIKIKIEEYYNSKLTVCLSFHIDHKQRGEYL